jgi:hypothetical protein
MERPPTRSGGLSFFWWSEWPLLAAGSTDRQSEGGLEKIGAFAEMAVIPILEPALRNFAGALAVSTVEPNDRRFRTTDYLLAVTDGAPDRNTFKIVSGLAHLPVDR